MREITLGDMREFEKIVCKKTGKRDMEEAMEEFGKIDCVIELLKIAGLADPASLSIRDLGKATKDAGLDNPFPDGV